MNFLESVAPPLYNLYIISPLLFFGTILLMAGSIFLLSFLYWWDSYKLNKHLDDGFVSEAHHNIRGKINIHAIKNQLSLSSVFKNRESDPYHKYRLMGIVASCVIFTVGVLVIFIVGS